MVPVIGEVPHDHCQSESTYSRANVADTSLIDRLVQRTERLASEAVYEQAA
jgi:hypothetical protein